MEFKLAGTAEEAIKQINEKHYALPFETDERRLFKIGVNSKLVSILAQKHAILRSG